MNVTGSWRSACAGVAVCLAVLLAACGGGGGDDGAVAPTPTVSPPPPPPPTPLPSGLTLTAPALRQALNSDVAFSSSAVDPGGKLTYRWEFGDGTGSTLAAPVHRFARTGSFVVRLSVSNETGASVQASVTVTVADLKLAQGKLCSGADAGGWCWQNPLPQGNSISAYAWATDRIGWAVGERGTVLKTSDGGVTWTAQVSGVESLLMSVAAVDANVVWIAGVNGLVLKTTDGGAIWRAISVGSTGGGTSIAASDASTAWLVGFNRSLTTVDGGTAWRHVEAPSFGAMVQASSTRLWAVDYGQAPLRVVGSTDGGTTWTVEAGIPAPDAGFSRSIDGLQFASAQHGLFTAVDAGYDNQSQYVTRITTWRTADGGATWQSVAPRRQPQNLPPMLSLAADGAIFLRDADGIFATTDAGATWQPITWPSSSVPGGDEVRPLSRTRLMLHRYDGGRYFSPDGGASWTLIAAGGESRNPVRSLWFFDARDGVALVDFGSILRTSDGGVTWQPETTPTATVFGESRIQFTPTASVGWLLAPNIGNILRSTDKGRSWLAPVHASGNPLAAVRDFHFVDEAFGWAIAPTTHVGQAAVFRTTDGGTSWQAVTATAAMTGMVSIRFADRSHGVAVGAPGLAWVTSDGGTTWQARPTGVDAPLVRVGFVDSTTAIAVGGDGVILRSTDRGSTWTRRPGPTTLGFNDVHFVSTSVGYAVGPAGVVVATRDAGLTWTDVSTAASSRLAGSFFLDENTGWVFGDHGAILVTVAGGRP